MAKPMLAYQPYMQILNTDGTVLSGGIIYFYQTGTTTALTVYPTSADAVASTNGFTSATLDSSGRPTVSSAVTDIYVTSAYKMVVKDSNGSTIRTVDNIVTLGQLISTAAKSTSYAVTVSDRDKVLVFDSSGGNKVPTLPAVATAGDGFRIAFKKMDTSANTIIITANAAETIDGSNTMVLSQPYDYVELTCDGTQWIQSTFKTFYKNIALVGSGTGIVADGFTLSQVIWKEVTVSKTDMASAASKILVDASGVQQFKIRNIILSGSGTNFSGGGGDRNMSITDGTTTWSIVPAATLQSLAAGKWGDIAVAWPTSAAAINTASAAGTDIVAKYSGGTTDYTAGSLTLILQLEKTA